MSSPRLALVGPVRLNGDEPRQVELWITDLAAVAFEGGTQVGALTALTLAFTDDRRLRLTGLDPDGYPMLWEAIGEEHVSIRWSNARVQWPNGDVWLGATVSGSQHGVRVTHGAATRDLPAAKLQAVGSQRWIISGSERILASDGRGCGCGGRR